jgi:hypothetical protein
MLNPKEFCCEIADSSMKNSWFSYAFLAPLWFVWVVGQDDEPQEVLRAAQQWRRATPILLHGCR